MKTLTLKLDIRTIIIAILLLAIAIMALLWKPWEGSGVRTLSATGQGEVKSTPDEFVFHPYFERSGDETAAKNELSTFGTKLISDLKKLGVAESDITVSSNNYGRAEPLIAPDKPTTKQTVTLSSTITVPSKELAQKVQDYLATTDAKGQLTSQSQFSQQKRRDLENQARDKAITDAKSRAEHTAAGLQASLGKVKEVKDGSQGIVYPLAAEDMARSSAGSSSLPVTPGQDTVTVSVEVIFELK